MNSKELILKLKEVEKNNNFEKELEYREKLKLLYENVTKSLNKNKNYFTIYICEYHIISIAKNLGFNVDNNFIIITKKGIKKLNRELRRTGLLETISKYKEIIGGVEYEK